MLYTINNEISSQSLFNAAFKINKWTRINLFRISAPAANLPVSLHLKSAGAATQTGNSVTTESRVHQC